MFHTCIFDLYGTLVDIHTDEEQDILWEKLALFYGYYGASYSGKELQERFRSLISEAERGQKRLRNDSHEAFPEVQIEQIFLRLFEEKGAVADLKLAVHAGQFFRVLSTEYVRLYDGTEEMLRTLKDNGKKVYLLSNAQKIFTEYEMHALHITKYFDGIFISSDFGCKKPDLMFYQKLLDTFRIEREGAIMIGNDGVCDILGAKRAGLSALYVHSNLSPEEETEDIPGADYIIRGMDMKKITKILISAPPF